MWVCIHGHICTLECMWRSEVRSVELLLLFHLYMGSRHQTQANNPRSKCFCPQSPLAICIPYFWLPNLTWHGVHGATVIHYYAKNIRDYTEDRSPSWIYQGGSLTLLQQCWETGVERPDRASGILIMKENCVQAFEEQVGVWRSVLGRFELGEHMC